jgi:Flp pilus assembly protein CpaB
MTRFSNRFRNVALAAIVGIAAMAITFVYAGRGSARAGAGTAATAAMPVFVAARDLPIGTPGSALDARSGIKLVPVAQADRIPDAVTSYAQIAQLVVTQPIYAGEQLTTQRFGDAGQQGIRSSLKGAMRITQLAGDPNQLLEGTLAAGDRVDVVASLLNPETGGAHYANTVLRNLLVVSAASDGASAEVGANGPSIDLELTDAQAARLFWVEKNASWTLLLRPSVGATTSASTIQSSATVLAGNHAG